MAMFWSLALVRTCIYLFVTDSLLHIETRDTNNSSLYTNILASIGKLCPYSNICGINLRPDDLPDDGVPCCKECYCGENCGRYGDCCFRSRFAGDKALNQSEAQCGPDCTNSSNDLTKIDTEPSGYSCIFPAEFDTLHEPLLKMVEAQSTRLRFYNMIDTCPSLLDTGAYQSSGEKNCGEMSVAPWGSLMPVYSPLTRQIYKNYKCAECHNVTDGIVWDVEQSCTIDNLDISSIVLDSLTRPSETSQCVRLFLYPEKWVDIEHSRCFRNVVSQCKEQAFDIPEDIALNSLDITEACESDFYSPVLGLDTTGERTIQKNVYCAICNSVEFQIDRFCRNENSNAGRQIGASFTFILKGAFVTENEVVNTEEISPQVCPPTDKYMKDNGACRQLLCPTGRVRTIESKCQYPSTKWISPLYICLELTPLQDVPLAQFEEIITIAVDSWLKSPWFDDWSIEGVVYQKDISKRYIPLKRLLVSLKFKYLSYNIVTHLRAVQMTLSKMWTIKLNGTSIYLSQKLARFCRFFSLKTLMPCYIPVYEFYNLPEKWHSIEDYFKNQSFCEYKSLVREFQGIPRLKITKLFFCQQVRLESSEFEFRAEGWMIYYKRTKEFFLENEFTVIRGRHVDSKDAVHMCVSDTGFTPKPVSACNRLIRAKATFFQLQGVILTFIWGTI